jgi:DNA-binding beta-propeller fold protein YncE
VNGEQYCRGVAYDEETGKIYAGIGSHAHLVEIDPATGTKTEMLPAEYHDQEFVYGVRVFHGHLFALLTRANKSLVFDLHTHKQVGVIPKIGGQEVMAGDDRGNVYYTNDSQLMRYSYSSPTQPPVKIARIGDSLGFTWQGNLLLAFTRYGAIVTCDPVTGKMSNTACKLPAEPTDIQSIALGPDGKIWTGGYLSGGNATFDPTTGKSEAFKGLSQAEGISSAGSVLYFGLYPGAKLSEYDTAKPWSTKDNNPHQFGDLGPENQSRPIAMLGVQSLNKVFIGTVPEYGQLGGVLAIYDIATKKLDVHHDVIAKQSICSLAFDKNLVVGGSTIWGGLGQKPVETEAKLFIWDPATNQKTAELSAVPGAKAITGLFVGPDGNIWGMADGTLFIFDPAAQKVLETHPLFPIHFTDESHVWRDANFVLTLNGQIFGAVHDQLFQLDPAIKKVTLLRDKKEKSGDLIAMDRDGKIYFHIGSHLWQYTP